MRLSIVIPAHNEEDHIRNVVKELHDALTKEDISFEIIIVNDNSKDRTGEIADNLAEEYKEARAVHRFSEKGFGKAVREGLASALGDCIILVMADKSDDPKDVVKIFRKLEEGYDVVYGSRFIRGSRIYNYPVAKLIINRLANYFIMALFLIKENDITNAFKGYNMKVIKTLWPLEAEHFNITAELPLKAYARGFTKVAVPVNWYGRESGVSKLSIIRMGQKYLKVVLRIWFMWLVGKFRTKGDDKEVEDKHWEEYWREKEDNTFLGRALFKLREKFWTKTFVKFALEVTDEKRTVLEAGSGSALSSIFLSRIRNDDITALDISSEALNKAISCAKKFDVRIKTIKGDLYNLPFNDKVFGLAWNSGTLEHFADPIPVLKEMRRVSDEVICIVPARGLAFSLLGFVSGLFGRNFKRYFLREDETFYSVESLSHFLKKAGFKDIYTKKIYCIGIFPYIAAYCKR